MQNKILQNKTSVTVILLMVLLLIFIRAFESQLFYDPFLVYFNGDYLKLALPDFDSLKLFLSLSFRYFLNATLSLGIIYFLFKDKDMIVFVSILYLFLFLILIVGFYSVIYFCQNHNNLLLFYVRRFLIQPLFLILFIPAFYYQKLKK